MIHMMRAISVGAIISLLCFSGYQLLTMPKALTDYLELTDVQQIERAYMRTQLFPSQQPYYAEFTEEELDLLFSYIDRTEIATKTKFNQTIHFGETMTLYVETAKGLIELEFSSDGIRIDGRDRYIVTKPNVVSFMRNQMLKRDAENKR